MWLPFVKRHNVRVLHCSYFYFIPSVAPLLILLLLPSGKTHRQKAETKEVLEKEVASHTSGTKLNIKQE